MVYIDTVEGFGFVGNPSDVLERDIDERLPFLQVLYKFSLRLQQLVNLRIDGSSACPVVVR